MNTLFLSSYKDIFLLSLLVYLITAYFSIGYYHPDEHFQIFEFCNYKLGNSPASDLPWEFHEKIRPALQPFIAWIFIKVLNALSIYNPFTETLILRILTAFLSWYVVSKTCLFLIKDFTSETGKKAFLFLSLFLWFIPSISIRFSSENYSAITFIAAIYLILQTVTENSNKKYFKLAIAGLLLGFSFFFRFQIAFAILGLGLWLILVKKIRWDQLFILMASGLCAMTFCVYLDYWFYGKLEFTPINYFFANIIENKASNWGTLPWWHYLKLFVLQAIPPISLFLIAFFFIGLYKRPTSIFSWCLIPFLIAHMVVAHKEMRFLFPMVFGFIYLTALGIDDFIKTKKYKKAGRFLFYLSVTINVPLLIIKMITPEQEAISYYKFLYDYSSNQKINLLCKEKDVYELVGLKANFYKSPNANCIVLKNDLEISNYLNKNKPDSIFLLERKLSSDYQFECYEKKRIFCLFPDWLLRFNINNWESRSRIWNIEKLRKTE